MNDWTTYQLKAITQRNKDILVSAAAGSGKTAVLVERIIRILTDEKDPVDINSLVVVTFTKDAAESMKVKISKAIQKLIDSDEKYDYLNAVLPQIHNAYIKTIDSFCMDILKEHCMEAMLEPGFTIADQGEMVIAKEEIIDEMLEEYYDPSGDRYEAFLACMNKLINKKDDSNFKDIILDIYNSSTSEPWPELWLESLKDRYEKGYYSDYKDALMNILICFANDLSKEMLDYKIQLDNLKAGLDVPTNKMSYNDRIESMFTILEQWIGVVHEGDFEKLVSYDYDKVSFQGCRLSDSQKELKNRLVKIFEAIKDYEKIYKSISDDKILEEIEENRELVCMIIDFTLDFSKRFSQYKKKKNLLEFHDVEQAVLGLLVNNENGIKSYTSLADELADQIEEIYIDEYQDSNNLQEEILMSISKSARNTKHNVFMVGDVKQSIYSFRSAKPDLFVGKYLSYPHYDPEKEDISDSRLCVELNANFRSRAHVLDDINTIFERTMTSKYGGIDYDERAALKLGKKYEEVEEPPKTEFLMIQSDEADEDVDDTEGQDLEEEGVIVAKRIRKLIEDKEAIIYDGNTKSMRAPHYGDIVILMRSKKNFVDYSKALSDYGIPSVVDDNSSYFFRSEICKVISFLTIIDNTYNDIELYDVMTSYFGGLTSNEAAEIKTMSNKQSMYENMMNYIALGTDDELKEKLTCLDALIEQYIAYKKCMPINELVWRIIYDTGYYDYMDHYTDENERKQSLDALVNLAKTYENTSYSGVFSFLKYIEKCRRYNVSYEMSKVADNDAVRLMTIHASKGLEFPIVILANTQKEFNRKDIDSGVFLLDSKYGITSRLIYEKGYKNSFLKKVLKLLKIHNLVGEELRLLYVALTRAMDKLIIIGDQSKIKNIEKPYSSFKSYQDIFVRSGFLDTHLYDMSQLDGITANSLVDEYVASDARVFRYPYEADVFKKRKLTVSDIKKLSIDEMLDVEGYVPKVHDKKDVASGAAFGSLYHEAMFYIDPSKTSSIDEIKAQLEALGDEYKVVDPVLIYDFYASDIGKRVVEAYKTDRLYREKQFLIGIEPSQIYGEGASDEYVMVQGVIDIFFKEDDGIVLLDYKTDHATNEKLKLMYSSQLMQYKEALTRLEHMPVKETYIYSVRNKAFLPL